MNTSAAGDGVSLAALLEVDRDPRAVLRAVREPDGEVTDWRFLAANRAFCVHVALPHEPVVGKRLTQVQPETDRSRIAMYAQVLTTGEGLVWPEAPVDRSADGDPTDGDSRCDRVDDETIILTLREPSEGSAVERELRVSEALFRTAVESSPIAVCLVAPDGTFLRVNDALCEFLGRDEESLTSSTWQELTHPDDLAEDLDLVDQIVTGQWDTYRVRKRYLRPDGSARWGDLSVGCVRNPDGSVRHFIGQIVDITDQVGSEQALRESRLRYRTLAENASDLVFRTNTELELEWISQSVTGLLGWQPKELVGRRVTTLVHPEDLGVLRDAAVRTGAGEPVTYEARFQLRTGSWKWLGITSRPVLDDAGGLIGRIGSGRDIDGEKAALAELNRKEQYLRAVLDSELDQRVLCQPVLNDDGTIADFIYIDANRRALAYLQRPATEILGARMLELFPAQRSSGLFDRYVACFMDDEPMLVDDFQVYSEAAQENRWLDLRAIRVGHTLSINWRDSTGRHRSYEALRRSEQRFRLLAENTSDIIVLADPSGSVSWISPSVHRTLGWHPEQLIGRSLDEIVHPDEREALRRRRAAVAAGQSRSSRLRWRSTDGVYHWVESRGAPYLDDNGAALGVMATVTLIDDRVAQEEALRRQATHDHLTGLLTREEAYRRLSVMLDHEPRGGARLYLAFIDVDNLKTVNDEFGHTTGDELLRVVARRTKGLLRDSDLIARIGGDELLIILDGVADDDTAQALMSRLLAEVNRSHVDDDGQEMHPRMSVGVAEVRPGDDIEEAVHRADQAMYQAKESGGNAVVLTTRAD